MQHVVKANSLGLAAVCGARVYDTEWHLSQHAYFQLTSLPEIPEDICRDCIAKLGPPNPNDEDSNYGGGSR